MKEFAEKYYKLGLNPICISYLKTKYNIKENNPEKSPCHSWKNWQVRRPKIEEVKQLDWNFSNGVGAVLGHSTKCIDIDNCKDYNFIDNQLRKGQQIFCTMKKFASIFNVKYPKLSEMYLYFFDDLPAVKLHDALNDIELLIDYYNVMYLYGYIKKDTEKKLII